MGKREQPSTEPGNHRTESPGLALPTVSEQMRGEQGWAQGGGDPAHLCPGPPGTPGILLLEALALTTPPSRHLEPGDFHSFLRRPGGRCARARCDRCRRLRRCPGCACWPSAEALRLPDTPAQGPLQLERSTQ